MKYIMIVCFAAVIIQSHGQTIVGTWQLSDEKTCFQSEMKDSGMKESDTEKELLAQMGGSSQGSVARHISFDAKGRGQEGVFSSGKKKGSGMNSFKYKINGQELLLLDAKSGIMTRQLVIDTLVQSTLRFHDAKKDCESRTFTRIK